MKFLTRSAVLLSAFILPTALNAAPVMVDGVNCGELATMSVNAAGTVTYTGKYMAVWEKRNGKWLVIRDIYNDDMKEK